MSSIGILTGFVGVCDFLFLWGGYALFKWTSFHEEWMSLYPLLFFLLLSLATPLLTNTSSTTIVSFYPGTLFTNDSTTALRQHVHCCLKGVSFASGGGMLLLLLLKAVDSLKGLLNTPK